MKTLTEWQQSIYATGRSEVQATYKEIIEALEIIAVAIIIRNGGSWSDYSGVLLDLRIALLNKSTIASALGEIGGSKTSSAKKYSSAENGKKGGRPKKIIEKDQLTT